MVALGEELLTLLEDNLIADPKYQCQHTLNSKPTFYIVEHSLLIWAMACLKLYLAHISVYWTQENS